MGFVLFLSHINLTDEFERTRVVEQDRKNSTPHHRGQDKRKILQSKHTFIC